MNNKNMNWYFLNKQSESYFDIGFSDTSKSKLWIWMGDYLSVADLKDKQDTHGIFSFIEGDNLSSFYRGRFELDKKIVSLVKPVGIKSFLDIPDALLNSLYEKFGYDLKIIEVGSNELF